MTTLDIVSTVIVVLVALTTMAVIGGSHEAKKAISKSLRETMREAWRAAVILTAAEESMDKKVSNKKRKVITRLVLRSSSVPLVQVLTDPEERDYLLRGLADPSEYPFPWEVRDVKDSGESGDTPAG